MSIVAKTLWLIEHRFRETPSLDDMAAHASVSRSHLSRTFAMATGYSISGYMRGRRLTEAARVLADGAPDILGVALDAGYGSHEAFTRAFSEHFGMTPEELRRRRSIADLNLVEAIRMDPVGKTSQLAAPVIEDHPALRLVGLSQHYDSSNMARIPDQWQRFGPHIPAIENGTPGPVFGVIGRMDGENDEGFDYLCGAPLPERAEVPVGLVEMRLPAARYARFRHEGHISGLRATCGAVFDEGLPALGRAASHERFSFLEYYGPDFEPGTGLGTVEIWVALAS